MFFALFWLVILGICWPVFCILYLLLGLSVVGYTYVYIYAQPYIYAHVDTLVSPRTEIETNHGTKHVDTLRKISVFHIYLADCSSEKPELPNKLPTTVLIENSLSLSLSMFLSIYIYTCLSVWLSMFLHGIYLCV